MFAVLMPVVLATRRYAGQPQPRLLVCTCSLWQNGNHMSVQVLPQLLHYMDVDAEDPESPDWGCIAVYSCINSCTPTGKDDQSSYMEEFAWVQPP